jgi:hypothetical protein
VHRRGAKLRTTVVGTQSPVTQDVSRVEREERERECLRAHVCVQGELGWPLGFQPAEEDIPVQNMNFI